MKLINHVAYKFIGAVPVPVPIYLTKGHFGDTDTVIVALPAHS